VARSSPSPVPPEVQAASWAGSSRQVTRSILISQDVANIVKRRYGGYGQSHPANCRAAIQGMASRTINSGRSWSTTPALAPFLTDRGIAPTAARLGGCANYIDARLGRQRDDDGGLVPGDQLGRPFLTSILSSTDGPTRASTIRTRCMELVKVPAAGGGTVIDVGTNRAGRDPVFTAGRGEGRHSNHRRHRHPQEHGGRRAFSTLRRRCSPT
jgi:hypothetical protein